MGAVSFSLDVRLVQILKSALPLDIFVETGSFKGDTVATMTPFFKRLITIELSEKLSHAVALRFQGQPNVEVYRGNSPEVLSHVTMELKNVSALYWLDAHWCVADDTVGERSQCPLLNELAAIERLNDSSVLLIDDARLFLAPPPSPHETTQWPRFHQVIKSLLELSDVHEVMVINDVIAFFPKNIRSTIEIYARSHGIDWLAVAPYIDPANDLIRSLTDKERIIESLHEVAQQRADQLQLKEIVIHEKERAIQEKVRVILEKESVIAEQSAAIQAYGAAYYPLRPMLRALRLLMRVQQRVSLILMPRLGVLNQHAPRAIELDAEHLVLLTPTVVPKISIVTPSFRQGSFIARTLSSVLDQNYPNLEYFVQDGGSQDETCDVLKQYSARLAGWESRPDNGQAHAINLGLAKTSGEIMAWLNSDDILLPGTLAYVANYFSQHPEVDVVYGHRLLINEDDRLIGRWIMPNHSNSILSWADYIPQETMFWRRRIWDKIGGQVDESFRFAMDWDLIVRFRDAGARFARLPRFLGAFRIHTNQKTSAEISEVGFQEMDRIRARVLGRIPSKIEVRKAVSSYLLRHVLSDLGWRIRQRIKIRAKV